MKWCVWSEKFIATITPYQRQLGLLELWRSEKGVKQATVLATERKHKKRWSNKGIPSHALKPLNVPLETRQVPNRMCLL